MSTDAAAEYTVGLLIFTELMKFICNLVATISRTNDLGIENELVALVNAFQGRNATSLGDSNMRSDVLLAKEQNI